MPQSKRNSTRQVDVNLLLALLEERNLTHAGARMAMTQPAMSGALTRLRAHFDDELLVRDGRGFRFTKLAERLRPVVAEAVEAAEALLGDSREFDPASSTKRFAVSVSEYAMTVLAEPLTRVLRKHAPGCTIAFDTLPARRADFEDHLMRRDLVVGPLGFDLPGSRQPVFTDHLVCLVARDNPRATAGRLSLADLAEMPHAVAEFSIAGDTRRPSKSWPRRPASPTGTSRSPSRACSPCPTRSPAPSCARSCRPGWHADAWTCWT